MAFDYDREVRRLIVMRKRLMDEYMLSAAKIDDDLRRLLWEQADAIKEGDHGQAGATSRSRSDQAR